MIFKNLNFKWNIYLKEFLYIQSLPLFLYFSIQILCNCQNNLKLLFAPCDMKENPRVYIFNGK